MEARDWDRILESRGYNRVLHISAKANVFGKDPRCACINHPDADTATAASVDALSELQLILKPRLPGLFEQ